MNGMEEFGYTFAIAFALHMLFKHFLGRNGVNPNPKSNYGSNPTNARRPAYAIGS